MSKFTKAISTLSAIFLLATSFGSVVYANADTVVSHTHSYQSTRGVSYEFSSKDGHYVRNYTKYVCACGVGYVEYDPAPSIAPHSSISLEKTGNHYHSGNYHYFEHLYYCGICNSKYFAYERVSCSGPPCIVAIAFYEVNE